MFDKFMKFYKVNMEIHTVDEMLFTELMKNTEGFVEFMSRFQGSVFGQGEYRIHKLSDVQHWNKEVESIFPNYSDFECFGSDWLGRQFALSENKLLMFDAETHEVYNMDFSFLDFHNECVVEKNDDCFTMEYYRLWLKEYDIKLEGNECVGYKLPLMSNGVDCVQNMEVKNMEEYWIDCRNRLSIWL